MAHAANDAAPDKHAAVVLASQFAQTTTTVAPVADAVAPVSDAVVELAEAY